MVKYYLLIVVVLLVEAQMEIANISPHYVTLSRNIAA